LKSNITISSLSEQELKVLQRLSEQNSEILSNSISPEEPKPSEDFKANQPKIEILSEEPSETVLNEALNRANDSYIIPVPLDDAAEFILFFDDALLNGQRQLHQWQAEDLVFLSRPGHTPKNPLEYLIVASNGSGKDSYIINPFVLWFICCKVRSRVVITSASAAQLRNQTENYIRSRGGAINRKLESVYNISNMLLIKRGHIVCPHTGSEIILFATDEPGKAEGYHPFPDSTASQLLIVVNEGKSVPTDIYQALSRCTYSHWLDVSSSGETAGEFYSKYTRAVHRPSDYVEGRRYARKVTSYDCPHVSRLKVKNDIEELGENHPVVRSKHFSDFNNHDAKCCIPERAIDEWLIADIPEVPLNISFGGLDLAGGGAENSFYAFRNNICLGGENFVLRDTNATAILLIEYIKAFGLKAEDIRGDDNGIGQAILDNAAGKGYSINRIRAQFAALNKRAYVNRGAEIYFNARTIIEKKLIKPPKNDDRLIQQLRDRRYIMREGRIKLESKEDVMADGRVSPDRADAFVIALSRFTWRDFTQDGKTKSPKVTHNFFSVEELERRMREKTFSEKINGEGKKGNDRLSFSNPIGLLRNLIIGDKKDDYTTTDPR